MQGNIICFCVYSLHVAHCASLERVIFSIKFPSDMYILSPIRFATFSLIIYIRLD